MAVEKIVLRGKEIATLKEFLRPGLKVVFIGLNPSPVSVSCGHYYQGAHGKRFWSRLHEYRITPMLPTGAEDEAAFEIGFGFADLIRRPTRSSAELSATEKLAGVYDLENRLSATGDFPVVIFTYAEPWNLARECLLKRGYQVLRMPGPYTARTQAVEMMKEVLCAVKALGLPPKKLTTDH